MSNRRHFSRNEGRGWPDGETPAIDKLRQCEDAQAGPEILPSPFESCLNRLGPPVLCSGNLTATWRSKRPSLRSASHTLPIPPCPIGDSSVYASTVSPARRRPAWRKRVAASQGTLLLPKSDAPREGSEVGPQEPDFVRARMTASRHAPSSGIASASSRYGCNRLPPICTKCGHFVFSARQICADDAM